MTITKKIKDWEKILLDTSVLCSLFRSQDSTNNDEQTLFTVKLISFLTQNKTSSGKDRIFYVSAITVSELLTRENDSEKIRRILSVLNSKNVEFIDFDLQTSLEFNSRLYEHLSRKSLHEIANEIGFKTGNYMMAREWITRDYMIIMSGVSRNVDVTFTADKKTFYPLTKNINNAFCVLVYPELFEQSEQFILNYLDNTVDAFLNKNKKVINAKEHAERKEITTPKS